MRMLRTNVNLELLAHGAAQRVLRQHALDGMLENALGVLRHGLGEGLGLESAGETAVAIVSLLRRLGAGHADLVSIDDDDEIARVDMRGVLRLVLAFEDLGGLGCHTTEDLVLSVDDDPLALDLAGLRIIRLHSYSSK